MARANPATRRNAIKALTALAGSAGMAASGAWAALVPTPRQIERPFYPHQRERDNDLDLTLIQGHTQIATGQRIFVRGRVVNLHGEPLSGARVDVWQANHHGRYRHRMDNGAAPPDEHFQGSAVLRTDREGRYQFVTIMPGQYSLATPLGRVWRCRHIHFKLSHQESQSLTTQMYFAGDPLIEVDQEIAKTPVTLRHLLIAESTAGHDGVPVYRFDVVLAGA